ENPAFRWSHHRLPVGSTGESLHLVSLDVARPSAIVVFSHGFLVPGFESHRMFLDIAKTCVAHSYRPYLFDYRGSGYSDGSLAEITIEDEILDLHAVLDAVKGTHDHLPLVLWGQSLGSGVATLVAADRSDIAGVILWNFSARLYDRYLRMFFRGDANQEFV